ncbi:MAG: hypothetical protein ACI9QR_002073, partial [Flavobacteriaceae bacterium]
MKMSGFFVLWTRGLVSLTYLQTYKLNQ